MKTTFLRKTASVLASASMLLASLAPLMIPSTAYANPPSIYTIAGSSSLTGTVLTVSGTASSTNMTGSNGNQHMAVDWDLDRNASTTSWIKYPDAGGLTSFSPVFFGGNNNNNADGFNATWSGSHDYSSLGGGTYHVKVIVYHTQPSGQDGSDFATVSFTIVIPPSTGGITVTKTTTGGDGTFNFTGTGSIGAFTITTSGGTGTKDLYNLSTSTPYTITETVPSGWDQTSNTCSSVSVIAGATSTCAVSNTKRGSITVIKDVVGPEHDGQHAGVSDNHPFNVTLDDGAQKSFSENTSYTFENVLPGSHTLAEIGDPDFDLLRISGDNDQNASNGAPVAVTAGQDTTVTITNGQHQGTLHVIKHVINLLGLEGFDKAASNFILNVSGTAHISPGSFSGVESPGTTVTMDPGTYSVTEPDTLGYAMSLSGDCTGVVMPSGGNNKTCTVTNSDFPLDKAALTVIKDISKFDNGGTVGAGGFTLRVNGAQVNNGAANILTPETYTVSEDPMSGYALNHIACSEGSTPVGNGGTLELVAGHAYTCTVFNDDLPGTLHVVKKLISGNGGTAATSTFSFSVNQGAPVVFNENGQNDITVASSTYSVTETATSTYAATYSNSQNENSDCSNLRIVNGGEATCTITNIFVPTPRDVTAPVSTFSDTRVHQTINTELVQLSLSGTSTDAVGPQGDPRSGVASAAMSIYRLADAQTMDGEGFFGNTFPGLTCSTSTLGEQVPTEIVALSLTSVDPLTVSWDPIHQTEHPLSSLDRGVYCAVVHATDNAGNVEHTAIAGPFAYTFTPSPTPTPTPPPSAPPVVNNGAISPIFFGGGSVLGASTSSTQGQVLGVSCGLYMNQHLKKGSAKNKPDQVTKLQQFLNKRGFGKFTPTGTFGPLTEAAAKAFQNKYASEILKPWGLSSPTGLVYLTTIRQLNLIECPDLTLPLPALVPWNANPNAQ